MQSTFEQKLHLIAFDIPVPVNYGGAIDIFYKVKSLHSKGIRIILHCFQYGREPAKILQDYCEKVYYYPRKQNPLYFLSKLPYIVKSRVSAELLKNLLADNHPILFEGLHSCYLLNEGKLSNRIKIVRTHNIEHDYYTSLGSVEKNYFRKHFFFTEAAKLRKFENCLSLAQGIASISQNDQLHFAKMFNHVERISAFHPFEDVEIQPGLGRYVLYHGSLEVGENNEAAMFLVKKVFSRIPISFVIAGNKASDELIETVRHYPNIEIRSGLATEEIYNLVANAQINILPTFQSTGIKLKLLAALFSGRHCIVNDPMIRETGLGSLCYLANTADEMIHGINHLIEKPFTPDEISMRRTVLLTGGFSNTDNADNLIKLIFRQ